jgi:hypothetical protein
MLPSSAVFELGRGEVVFVLAHAVGVNAKRERRITFSTVRCSSETPPSR